MKKPDSLRTHMLNAVKELQRDPDRLLTFVDKGNVRCTMANGLSFEYVYEINLVFTNFAGEPDAVMLPLLDWVRTHQHELLVNAEKSKEALKFEAELLSNHSVDLSITLPLSERVIVKRQDNGTLDIFFPMNLNMKLRQNLSHSK